MGFSCFQVIMCLKFLIIVILTFQGGVGENGADFGTFYAMADEDAKEHKHCKSYDNKDVEFSVDEAEQERNK